MQDNNQEYHAMLPIGAELQMGKYRVERYLSSGGFGNTYVVRNVEFDEVFAMKEDFLLCKASEKYGRELLNEVLVGGNFGQSSDEHAKLKVDDEGKETFVSKVEGNFATIKRGMKLFWSYPSECLWVPFLCIRASWVRNYWRKVKFER